MHQWTRYFIRLLISCILLLASKTIVAAPRLPVQNGDIIFQTSLSSQSSAVQEATHSPYSHMGIVIMRNNEAYVLEAVKTVRYTPLDNWIKRGKKQQFVIKRLRNTKSISTQQALEELYQQVNSFINKPYDLAFEWSDSHIYCSELVWKIYDRAWHIQLAPLQTIADYDLTGREAQKKLKERYGDQIPLSELTISPAAIFNSSLLETVITQ